MSTSGLTLKQLGTLERFVIRARRVAAHSLAGDLDGLRKLAQQLWHVSVPLDGTTVTMTWEPPDEERFESLAARLRPFVLASESVHHRQVIAALRAVVAGHDDEQLLEATIAHLEARWSAWDPEELRLRGFALQQADANFENARSIDDGVLAGGWLYADVVHADPKMGKEAALDFPLAYRFMAAVPLFANIALVVLETLGFIETLRDEHGLNATPGAWDLQVSVSPDDFVHEEVTAYMAPHGTIIPELGQPLPEEAQLVTSTLLTQRPRTRTVTVRFLDATGEVLHTQEGQTVPSGQEEGFTLHVGRILQILVERDKDHEPAIETHFSTPTSNEDLVDHVEMQMLLAETSRIVVTVPESDASLFTLDTSQGESRAGLSPNALAVLTVASDLVAVSEKLGLDLPLIESIPGPEGVMWLRVLRLGLEGWVVRCFLEPQTVTTPTGRPPEVVVRPAHDLQLGNLIIPFPEALLWHPSLTSTPIGSAGVDMAESYRVSVPPGEPFLIQLPDHVRSHDGTMRQVPLGLKDLGFRE